MRPLPNGGARSSERSAESGAAVSTPASAVARGSALLVDCPLGGSDGCAERGPAGRGIGYAAADGRPTRLSTATALLTRLTERTTVPVDALRAMTVEGYVPLLIDQLTPTPDLMQTYTGQYWFFVIPEGRESQRSPALVPWQASAQRRMRTCPLCLCDDARPYRRIYWRLAW